MPTIEADAYRSRIEVCYGRTLLSVCDNIRRWSVEQRNSLAVATTAKIFIVPSATRRIDSATLATSLAASAATTDFHLSSVADSAVHVALY